MSVSVQATFAATLVDEWVRAGVTHAVVCPGSRSTPLALAVAERPELSLHVRLDERGAGFFALGLGMATGRPAVVVTTSGTAAVELHPAVVEAHYGRVPVIVCTADRPPELRDVGAAQTIDQQRLYGAAPRWFCDPGVAQPETRATWRSLGARALHEAVAGPSGPGPVHLNLPFREPLVGQAGPLPPPRPRGWVQLASAPGTEGGAPAMVGGEVADGDVARRWVGRRGVIVAGDHCGAAESVLGLGRVLGWPVLADPRSGCRLERPGAVGAADALLRPPEVRRALLPEVVLQLGGRWSSPALAAWMAEAAGAGAEVALVDPWWRWGDPDRLVTAVHRAEPDAWLAGLRRALGPAEPPMGEWAARWQAVEAAAQRAIEAETRAWSEPALVRHLFSALDPSVTVLAAASMPMRDLEWYAAPRRRPPRVLVNRGANGIDGLCSTAQGVAAAGLGPVVALVGDLAFFHDVSSLVRGTGAVASTCVLVVVDNGGGGIFSFLPQAETVAAERFEDLFGTPQTAEVIRVAAGFGLPVAEAATAGDAVAAVAAGLGRGGLSVVRAAMPDRGQNVVLHRRLEAAVAAAARQTLGLGD